MWPCLRPNCSNKVDPDGPTNYCSKTCENAVKTKDGRASEHKVAMHRLQTTKAWFDNGVRNGYISQVDTPFNVNVVRPAFK